MFGKVKNTLVESGRLIKGLNLNLKLYFASWAIISLVQTPLYLGTFFLIGLWVPFPLQNLIGSSYLKGFGEPAPIPINIHIGLIFGLSSIIGIVGLVISGIFSDRWRRDVFIWIAMALFIAAMIYFLFAQSLTDLYIIQIAQSIASSLLMPAGAAMVADCTAKGTRTKIYTLNAVIVQIFAAFGGVFGYLAYRFIGNTYTEDVIMPVIRISVSVIIVTSIAGFFIHDKRSLTSDKKEEDEISIEEKKKNALILEKFKSSKSFKDKLKFYRTPLIIVLADFVIAFGAGIIIPFLPRYFESPHGPYAVSISDLTLIFATAPLLTAILSAVALYFGKKIGRARAVFAIELIAVILLFCFSFFPPLWLILIIYIVRQAAMNSGWPLINAIVMDLLPANQRATFSAIDSLAFTAFNSLSQPIGGKILDDNPYYSGFRMSFYITSGVYLVGVIMLLFIKEGSFEIEEVEGIEKQETKESREK